MEVNLYNLLEIMSMDMDYNMDTLKNATLTFQIQIPLKVFQHHIATWTSTTNLPSIIYSFRQSNTW